MKKAKATVLAACLTILSSSGFADSGAAATTIVTDLSNFAFYNGCTDEFVLTGPGSYVHGVIRFDQTNGTHLLNKSAGQVHARGVQSGTQYIVNITDDAVPSLNLPNIVNNVDGNGNVGIVNTLKIIQPNDPTTGVFIAKVVIQLTRHDGVLTSRVFSMTGECHGQ